MKDTFSKMGSLRSQRTKELKEVFTLGLIFLSLLSTSLTFVSIPQVNAQNVSLELGSQPLELAESFNLNNSVETISLLLKWSDVWTYYVKEHRAILGIPPDAELINVSIENATRFSENFSLNFSETTFRCYKVATFSFQEGFDSREDTYVNVTYIQNKHSTYPAKYDELADAVAPTLLINYEQAKWWKGYPVLSVNKTTSSVLPSGPYKYIIITKEEWVDSIRPLAKWKENKGLPVYIASVEWIDQTYAGASLPSKIKEFLKDAYNNWHFDYVILAGGVNTIPTYYQFETAVPQDWYYVYLDEEDPPEWSRSSNFPEAVIGRLPAENEEELQAIVSKLISYESNPSIDEWLHTGIEVYGRDFEDNYELLEGHLIENLTYKRLIYGYNLTKESFISSINEGASFIFVSTHGNSEEMTDALSSQDIDRLKNGLKTPVIYATSCSVAAFDRPPNIGSILVSKSQGGAVLFFGKTRIGVETASVPLRDFLELANWRVGLMAFYFRIIGNVNPSNHILGDPEMSIWTIKPKLVSIQVPSEVLIGEDIVVTITDPSTEQPLQGIITRIRSDNTWIELITNETGQVAFKASSLHSVSNLSIYALLRNQPTRLNTTIKLIPPDTTPPEIIIISPSSGYEIKSHTITVTWMGSDDTSGISHYDIRLDNYSWIDVGTNTTHTFIWLDDRSHTIEVKATDKVGLSKQDSVSFIVNTSPLLGPGYTEENAILAATLIVAIGSALYFFKIRKR